MALFSARLSSAGPLDACTPREAADCGGQPLGRKEADPWECCALCQACAGCKAFTHRWGTCFFVSSCDFPQPCEDCQAALAPAPPPPPLLVISGMQTTKDGKKLSPIHVAGDAEASESVDSIVTVDTAETYQTILGFGGAFTEAAAVNFAKLSETDKDDFMRSYFAPPENGGNGYTMGRVHINSCDFSVKPYSFDDSSGDTDLSNFDMRVTHDQKHMVPMIQRALSIAPQGLKIFASPWSPPAWMKTNGQMSEGGSLKPEYRRTWANYISKFFQAYKYSNVSLWGLTVQNEPGFSAAWESCRYSAEQERDFLKDHLGPVMRHDHPDAKIMVLDHNRGMAVEWTKTIYGDAAARKYADGLALHWYGLHGAAAYRAVDQSAEIIGKDKIANGEHFILGTEATLIGEVKMHDWDGGWSMAEDIMGDLNAWSAGWVDWNLIVDSQGGPNHVGNWCNAAMLALDEGLLKQPFYYQMGQFSRFLRPGMKRVKTEKSFGGLDVTAAVDEKTHRTAVVLMNAGDTEKSFRIHDKISGRSSPLLRIPGHSIQSYTYTANLDAAGMETLSLRRLASGYLPASETIV
eukprot:TRINITY_DN51365_c0_g1_i1.p1 TRINITY_DN51365_c0_g1~~TRINITY_DN51365_c0_g1_i1.p1  ORF type:complete len:601 (+),score=82.30 TRINITY_DN51365_c0_g1_i1:76-1803(+)